MTGQEAAGKGGIKGVRKELLQVAMLSFFTLIVLAPLMTIGMSDNTSQMDGEGTQTRQIAYILVAFFMMFSLRPVEDYRRLFVIPLPLLIGLGVCWISLVWAVEPNIALRRLILTTVVMWTLFAGVRRLAFEESMTIFRVVLLLLLVANYMAVLVKPEYAIHLLDTPEERGLIGDWRGIMQHKNIAGATSAVAMILFIFDADRFNKWLRLGVIVAAAFFLVQSGSKTSSGMVLAAVAVGFIYTRYKGRHRGALIAAVSLLGIIGTLIGLLFHNPLNVDFTDPHAFTGRPLIWKALTDYIIEHPLFGSGYGSFWNIGPTSPIYHYASGWPSRVATGHDGFLDLAAQLGIPGMMLIVGVTIFWPMLRLVAFARSAGQRGALIVTLYIFCVGHNFTESSIFDRDQFVWVTLMLAIALTENMTEGSGVGFDMSRVKRQNAEIASRASGKPLSL